MSLDPLNDVGRIPLGGAFRRSPRRRDRIKDEEAKHEKWLRTHVPGYDDSGVNIMRKQANGSRGHKKRQ